MRVADVRAEFRRLLTEQRAVSSRGVSQRTIEIVGASFTADEPTLFGEPNREYISRELAWYDSMSRSLADFPGRAPKVWRDCACADGYVNSNYGWCVYSADNGWQYDSVLRELRRDPSSRRAVAVYTRPSMHLEAVENGRNDFMCTNAVQYLLRGTLSTVVQMRSNDAVIGYRNDWAWQARVLRRLAEDLGVPVGTIVWQVGSLHVYERDWGLV